jgi:hypothetical protein
VALFDLISLTNAQYAVAVPWTGFASTWNLSVTLSDYNIMNNNDIELYFPTGTVLPGSAAAATVTAVTPLNAKYACTNVSGGKLTVRVTDYGDGLTMGQTIAFKVTGLVNAGSPVAAGSNLMINVKSGSTVKVKTAFATHPVRKHMNTACIHVSLHIPTFLQLCMYSLIHTVCIHVYLHRPCGTRLRQ